jgi:hypothetical protein
MCDNLRECTTAKAQGFGTPPIAPARDDAAVPVGVGRREIRPVRDDEFDEILAIVNEAAQVYRGVIPADRWHDPYSSAEYLRWEIDAGVRFFGYDVDGELLGVMGVQDVDDVTLIRHA